MNPSRREFLTWFAATILFPDLFLSACANPNSSNSTAEKSPQATIPLEAMIFPPPEASHTPTLVLEPTSTQIPEPTPTFVAFVGELHNRKKVAAATATITATPTPLATESLRLADQFIWRGNPNKPNVALTFDDGWWPEQIVKFIEIIKKTNTPLTVFLAGQAIDAIEKAEKNQPYRSLIRQLDELGCEFGCHSYAHEPDFAYKSVGDIVSSIEKSQIALDNAVGRHIPFRFFRPPGGAISWNMVEALKKTGLKGVIWTLSGEGTSPTTTSSSIHDRIVGNSANGFITLQHFIDKDTGALEPIINDLRGKGLNPTTLSNTL